MGNLSTFSDKQYIGIDIGTTSVKMLVINQAGTPIAQERVEYETNYLGDMQVEQNPESWWLAIVKATHQILGHSKVDFEKIRGIAVSSQAPVLLGIDQVGMPTSDAIIWMDRRAEQICRQELVPFVHQIEQITCNPVDPYYMLPKVIWQKKYKPEVYKNTHTYLQVNGYIVYRMTGKCSIDRASAALTQFYDTNTEDWAYDMFSSLDVDFDKFPPIYECSSEVGFLQEKAASLLRLPSGIPVLAGCYDGAAAALGLNMMYSGDTFEMSGQSSGIGRVIAKPKYNSKLSLLHQALGHEYFQKGSMSATGGSLQWFRNNIDSKNQKYLSYQEYDQLASLSVPGSNGLIFLPYMLGERAPIWDSYARGVFFGLGLDTSRNDIIRSIMEGAAFGLRSILEQFDNHETISSIVGTGGGYLSHFWSQIKADVLNVTINVPHIKYDVTAQGVSLLNLIYQGEDISQLIPSLPSEKTFFPREENHVTYSRYYKIFCELYEVNKSLFTELYQIKK